ncbi:hypothetical protein Bmayo_00685 [Borreliella mayonii]|uniref:Uncharacterized protein n=1 Tax=Borreliella mayonii TaxID=1674146 RepID=A0AAC9KTM2_9SPIR|nr:hypothetical protein [Borreliella mayonii]APS98364.1 hypothetical protein A7X70_00685 [Borreliella mayonii]APS99495.1 hypothetical protein Bmayo_00685 [Borreliella mayonii]
MINNDKYLLQNKFYHFILIVTEISPFHSFIKARVSIFYKLIHRIQAKSDKYNFKDYENYISFISEEKIRKFFRKNN